MNFFKNYTSNTYAGCGNQFFFEMEEGEIRTGRAFYKISNGGKYNYSFLFSNIMDSTYAEGNLSNKNLICDSYIIHEAKVGISSFVEPMKMTEDVVLTQITFNGAQNKKVMPGEFFCSDQIELEIEKNQYICIEVKFSGRKIPYHEESLLPMFTENNGVWEYSKLMPVIGMVGCDRKVKKRICYMGDSITQGIGTDINSYEHWAARVSEKLGDEYAFWNIGIGYGRADDAASNGAWLYKAKQNDIVVVCFGVNDILRGFTEETIKSNIELIVDKLKEEGIKVILQTVPPFDYTGEKIGIWENVNTYIKEKLSKKADMIFDVVPYLGESEEKPFVAKYGGHPDSEGCKIWANGLYPAMREFLDNLE